MGNARKAKGAKLSFSGVSVRGGTGGPSFYIFMEGLAQAFARQAPSRPQGTGGGISVCPGKQEPCVGHAHGTSRVRARLSKDTNTVRDLLTAGVITAGAGFLPARENRSSAWACTQKEPRACAAGRRHKPGARLARRSRACVRDAGKKRHGARLAHRRCARRRCVNSGCGLRRWCAGSRGPCDCRACRGTRHKPF